MPRYTLPSSCRVGWLRAGLVLLALPLVVLFARPASQALTPLHSSEQTTPDSVAPPLGSPLAVRQQILERMGAESWHKAGHRGRGVKVAILDSGFRGYRQFLGNVLPAKIQAKSFRIDGNLEARDSQHGILCAEVVHAVAPDAELLFANWEPDQPERFLDAVRWARQQGAKVISCSLIMPSWSDGEGGGEVNAKLASLVGDGTHAGDVLCFASAGNTAQRHWCGSLFRDPDGYHQWRAGRTSNLIVPWGSERVSVEVYGPPGIACELCIHEAGTGRCVGSACPNCDNRRDPGCCRAVVRFQPTPSGKYQVKVRCDQQPCEDPFHVVVLGGSLDVAMATGSISCPADCPAVYAVGAVDSDSKRLHYSSCGPNSRKPKPDFVAQVPFPSVWRARPFAGTSAAAPQAAGLAALVQSRHPDWTAGQVGTALKGAARDLGPPGHDCETGYGRLALP